jgi:hypothetical protein
VLGEWDEWLPQNNELNCFFSGQGLLKKKIGRKKHLIHFVNDNHAA